MRGERKWRAAAEEHRAALRAFVESAERVEEARWTRPLADGKWSPAQVAEHCVLVYDAVLQELAGGAPVRMRVSPAWRTALRWVLLPHILFHRSFPVRAVAPREVRPPEGHPEREEVLERLRERGERVERALDAARRGGGGRITHAYFGSLPAATALRFAAVHLEHHRRQISA